MRKFSYIIILIFITLLNIPVKLSAQQILKIMDINSNEPVSFTVVIVQGLDISFEANVDGLINIELKKDFNYKFKRLGYREQTISGEQLLKSTEVKMEILPIEINPIIVTANAAWLDLNKAINNTFNLIQKSIFFLKCYQNDKVQVSNSILVDSKAIYVSEVLKLNKKGKGCKSTTKLTGLRVQLGKDFKADSIKRFSYYETPFINDYLVGENQKYDNDLSFYFIDTNDSIAIIGYSPKLKYIPNNKYVLSSGRYIINKENWSLIRIDSEINPKLIDNINEKIIDNPKKELLFKSFFRTIYFSKNGIPAKLEEKFEYTLKNDKNKLVWVNSTSHVYRQITEKEFNVVPRKKTESKSIIYQKPFFMPSFESEYEKGIK